MILQFEDGERFVLPRNNQEDITQTVINEHINKTKELIHFLTKQLEIVEDIQKRPMDQFSLARSLVCYISEQSEMLNRMQARNLINIYKVSTRSMPFPLARLDDDFAPFAQQSETTAKEGPNEF